ncbi:type II CRISPR-associated endonuclease Cas1 [Caldibacillus thermoamylovorans]|uniref:type II CRISPR-associated endonuclease Cas1 n=1 Tax=Bacillaceae TaxID=186817 RepID=UPI00180EDDD6|nr:MULTISPECIES: type II CRISPR-associated endonuclease Cas1 [Bacillaceae]MCB5935011.1 type II CRISPR-associated endonuclease Cas1 [Bacillus sp. DFI.2.34]MCB7076056.1 type II CRISPR-associated endonuclease Cas1 [Caldibacillus thermoamylovorans]MED3641847.1 type II CRISPR-associated endonuclease Cas1 [Caldifermentibacillus hisashii]NWN96730.1 type II CRISPR-associated endonuclease Cas1 [Bacillus sp. (in: firmicutes)]
MSWRIIYISESEQLKLYLDNLKVVKGEHEVLIPLSDIHTIVVDNPNTTVTGRLMNKLTEYHILLIFCDENHNPNVFSLGLYSHYRVYGVLSQQLKWSDQFKGEMWKKIVQIKISNQSSILKFLQKNEETITRMNKFAQDVLPEDSTNREGHAAKIYFNELLGEKFKRGRNATDAFNAALNYGYIVLRACFARTVVAYGLHPSFGIGHRSQFNAFNLVDDCMEVFRPIIDLWVVLTIQEGDYLDREKKQQLIGRLSAKIEIGGQKQTVLNAIDLFVQSFIKAMNNENLDYLVYPKNGLAV